MPLKSWKSTGNYRCCFWQTSTDSDIRLQDSFLLGTKFQISFPKKIRRYYQYVQKPLVGFLVSHESGAWNLEVLDLFSLDTDTFKDSAGRSRAVQYSPMQCSAVQFSAVQYRAPRLAGNSLTPEDRASCNSPSYVTVGGVTASHLQYAVCCV